MTRLLCLAAVVMVAACTTASTPVGTPTITAAPTSAATAAATAEPILTASSSDPTAPRDGGPGVAAPPPILLTVPGIGPVSGDLGSYTWGGFASDSPWIVEPAGQRVRNGADLAVTVDGITADHWTATWAPISNGKPGQGIDGGSGSSRAPILVAAPAQSGTWSLRVEAWFGSRWHAAWFWRLEVQPQE